MLKSGHVVFNGLQRLALAIYYRPNSLSELS